MVDMMNVRGNKIASQRRTHAPTSFSVPKRNKKLVV